MELLLQAGPDRGRRDYVWREGEMVTGELRKDMHAFVKSFGGLIIRRIVLCLLPLTFAHGQNEKGGKNKKALQI